MSILINDDSLLFQALAGLWYYHQIAAEIEPSFAVAKQLLQLAQSTDEPAWLKFAHFAMPQNLQYLGDLVPCADPIRQSEGITGAERRATTYHLGDALPRWLAVSANAFWQLGYPDQAMARSRTAIAEAEKLSHAYVLAVTRMFCGFFCADCRYIQTTIGHADAGIALSSEYGFSLILPNSMIQRGWALVHLGEVEAGFDQISRGVSMWPSKWAGFHLFRRLIVDAYLLAKRAEDGLLLASESLQELDQGKRRMDHAELYRLKGELLLLQNPDSGAEAEVCFRAATDIAARQQARSWQLRSTVSLARLLIRQGRRQEARAMLAEIYKWFTEGFDTADLKDAKALLDRLGSES